jgi:hypothetical protein
MLRRAVPLLLCACASAGDPPGGPPDDLPPTVVLWAPDSGAVLSQPPERVEIVFDEVINERVAAQPSDIYNAVLLSPDTVRPRVRWHRNRITVQPRGGFKPGRVYHVQLLPVITDLRTNRLRDGRTIVFSTGPGIPAAQLTGTLVDWPGNRVTPNALIEAVLLPDSLFYRALTDSAGNFRLRQIPPGEYLVYGTMDQNNDRRRGGREAFDTVRVTLSDSSDAELFAFVHDTTGPRIRTVELTDSLTVRVTFDRALDPADALDTSRVHLAPAADTAARFGVAAVFTARQADSARAADAARAQAERAARDTTRRAAPPPADTARPAPARPAQPARDSTRAQRMLARRPPPTDVRVVRLTAPLAPGERYAIQVRGARSLSGVVSDPRGQLVVPRPRPTRDTTRTVPDTLP